MINLFTSICSIICKVNKFRIININVIPKRGVKLFIIFPLTLYSNGIFRDVGVGGAGGGGGVGCP